MYIRLLECAQRKEIKMAKGLRGRAYKDEITWFVHPGEEKAEGEPTTDYKFLKEGSGGRGRLMAAVEKQVSDPVARKLMIQSLAQGNCNAVCKRIIEALPREPSMSDMAGACAKISLSSQQVVAMHTAVQPAGATIVQPTVATAVQPALPVAVQLAVAAAVQPAWVVPQGLQQQQWGARTRKETGRKGTEVYCREPRTGRKEMVASALQGYLKCAGLLA
ncbi:hypothetical protein DUI87_04997 [Hirundo rustica rustica]|uniref:Retroviral nucleocapsid Gag protein p24 C-terminal domain-containing protein n=1 Tax=Hirundo rustica rustica TaxID=333673 RepID=A0A3M0KY02_HIRRU|nr:hypothetical protein DUI87_04997 [Hirundo rustica rustica]